MLPHYLARSIVASWHHSLIASWHRSLIASWHPCLIALLFISFQATLRRPLRHKRNGRRARCCSKTAQPVLRYGFIRLYVERQTRYVRGYILFLMSCLFLVGCRRACHLVWDKTAGSQLSNAFSPFLCYSGKGVIEVAGSSLKIFFFQPKVFFVSTKSGSES